MKNRLRVTHFKAHARNRGRRLEEEGGSMLVMEVEEGRSPPVELIQEKVEAEEPMDTM